MQLLASSICNGTTTLHNTQLHAGVVKLYIQGTSSVWWHAPDWQPISTSRNHKNNLSYLLTEPPPGRCNYSHPPYATGQPLCTIPKYMRWWSNFTYREPVRCGDMHRTGNQFQLPEIIKTIWAIYLQSHHQADAITRILHMHSGGLSSVRFGWLYHRYKSYVFTAFTSTIPKQLLSKI